MYCKNCGKPINKDQYVCLNCGVKCGTGKKFCLYCGTQVGENAIVCLGCGASTEAPKSGNSGSNTQSSTGAKLIGGQDKTVIAIICFFFGGWGVHNFMMGEKNKGILRLVLFFVFGISWILALIDFIQILTDTYTVEKS